MIKDILDRLPDKERRRLMYALENEISQTVFYDGDKFIAVYVDDNPLMRIDQRAGSWCTGVIIKRR